MLTSANRIPHDTLTCLKPCVRTLVCGHKCSGVCTDPCRCCENCEQFKVFRTEQQMAELRLDAAPWSTSTMPTAEPDHIRDSSPEKWVEFSKNPEIHDDVIRDTRLQAMKPLIELDTTPATAAEAGKQVIKERFIPVSNQDGQRVIGQQAGPRGRHPPPASSQTRNHSTDHRRGGGNQKQDYRVQSNKWGRQAKAYHQKQSPHAQLHGRAPVKDNRSQATSASRSHENRSAPVSGQHSQVQVQPSTHKHMSTQPRQGKVISTQPKPTSHPRKASQPPVQGSGVAQPSGASAVDDLMSLMGESDLGFEAEVLGIRRGRHAEPDPVNTTTAPQRVQMDMAADVESLMTFGGDGADSDDADSPTEPGRPPKKEQKEELLIDI